MDIYVFIKEDNKEAKKMRVINSIKEYIIITLMILASKTVYFGLINAKTTYIVFFATLVVLMLFERKTFSINKKAFYLLASVMVVAFGQVLANYSFVNSAYINTMIISYFPFLLCYMSSKLIDKEVFMVKYVNVISVIAIISLVCFGIASLYPMIAWGISRPVTFNNHIYNMSMFYTWGWNSHIFARNSGPFWEPGAFQGFLILGLLFILHVNKEMSFKRIKLVLLGITIITTNSTTGYILLLLIVVAFYRKIENVFVGNKGKKYANLMRTSVVVIFVLVVGYVITSGNISDKFSNNNVSGMTRVNDFTSSFMLMFDKPILGYGFSPQRLIRTAELSVENDSVGLWSLFYTCGIPFGIIYLIYMFKGVKRIFAIRNWWTYVAVILIFLILHLTEALWWLPVYVYFLFVNSGKLKVNGG